MNNGTFCYTSSFDNLKKDQVEPVFMTTLLEKAVSHVKKLTSEEQDAIAVLILEELEDEEKWDAKFAGSPELLAALAAEAEKEDQAGKTQQLDPDTILGRVPPYSSQTAFGPASARTKAST